MSTIDWIVLIVTLLAVIGYGLYKSKSEKTLDGYFKSSNSMSWILILLSIMGTQASAITFLSAPGQAYTDGMRFVQYYFGLPLAMVVLCVTFIPIYHKLKVFTAYEYLEQRFDLKTRSLASILFLVQRALSTGISIYAPSIILSSLLGWNIYYTNLVMGGFLIIYTVTGGTKAVTYTQMQQLIVVFIGMFLAGYLVVHMLPEDVSFSDALHVAGKMGKLNVIETKIDVTDSAWWKDKYNIWSGVIGGFFLALSYFGTDQSQVGRYLTAKNTKESRTGLLMNGLVKVPMQFLILLVGSLVFVFYMFFQSPIFFNQKEVDQVLASEYQTEFRTLQVKNDSLNTVRQIQTTSLAEALHTNDRAAIKTLQTDLLQIETQTKAVREQALSIMKKANSAADTNDTNYIFLYFVVENLPKGLIGLLIAMIFLAAWGSIAAALNSLASTTVIDLYKRLWVKDKNELHYYKVSRWFTFGWGIFAIATAMFASKLGSLIEAVNVLGSLFYGTILGIFLVAFYLKRIGGKAVFLGAIITEILVIGIYAIDVISFLWLNVIGCLLVLLIAGIIQLFLKPIERKEDENLEIKRSNNPDLLDH
ncbi:sodium:solute symporter [Fluviicola chungangensis]|uniref:Sodium:solute symporter n=1 Tax=Fluviicola chungangensis TaxID=2597671 RepID=A0A556MQ15_9FLAO|nr:sodium:solute symporter [Fluviicola chungangensis]TSJ42041.1 sodium:solute symporter [Fluviicola chungangensis]